MKNEKLRRFILFFICVISIICINAFAEESSIQEDENDKIAEKDNMLDSNNKSLLIEDENGISAFSNDEIGISYSTHVQYIGWQGAKSNGEISGTSGLSLRLEGIKIALNNNDLDGSIKYRTHIQYIGWQGWKQEGELSGTTGLSVRLEAIQIELTGEIAEKYNIYYSVHVQDHGWTGWAKNGEIAGSVGYGYRLEAIKIKLIEKDIEFDVGGTHYYEPQPKIYGKSHIQYIGWRDFGDNSEIIGTVGQGIRIEAFTLGVLNYSTTGGIKYSSYINGSGWQNEVSDNSISGTTGQNKKIEAMKINLTGQVGELYDIYYSVHVQNLGWLGWAKNGEITGSKGYNYQIEAIKIKLVPKNSSFDCGTRSTYYEIKNTIESNVHTQNIGWSGPKINSTTIGTTGKNLRMEAIKLSINNPVVSGGIEYSTHVQYIGWQNWKKDGELAGTTGLSVRIEAIKIKLTGELANTYDIYYRAHVQNMGWLDWAKNGDPVGSRGISYRMEALQIVLVEKGSVAPGSTKKPFAEGKWVTSNGKTYYYNAFGVMENDFATIDGTKYFFNRFGELVAKNARRVIDVSHNNNKGKEIDWEAVKKNTGINAVDGVIVRVSYGSLYLDNQYENNIKGLNKANIPYGIYLRTTAENQSGVVSSLSSTPLLEGALEALRVIKAVEDYNAKLSYPIYYDIETWDDERNKHWQSNDWNPIIQAFSDKMKQKGYQNKWRIYANKSTAEGVLASWKNKISWIAQYNDRCTYGGSYNMWQYRSDDEVPGISGDVDSNVYGDFVS